MIKMMKSVRYHGIQDVRFEKVEKPVPAADEVLIKVAYAGICGSDLHIYNKGMFIENIPEVMGHEFVGQIEETGAEIKDFKIGDLVAGNPMVTCGMCPGCSAGLPNTCSSLAFIGEVCQGCFAEYITMKEEKLIRLQPGADLKQAALTEPLAVALNICEMAELSQDDEIAVIGAGPIGLLTVLTAKKLYNVRSVTVLGRSGFRMELAGKVGADRILSAFEEDKQYAKIIEAAGKKETLQQAVSHTAPCGSIYVVSIFEDSFSFDINGIVAAQQRLVGCNAYEKRHLQQAADILSAGRLDVSPLITKVLPLEECREAFQALNEKNKKQAKILFAALED